LKKGDKRGFYLHFHRKKMEHPTLLSPSPTFHSNPPIEPIKKEKPPFPLLFPGKIGRII
jgi:hypothetical protein